MIWNSIRRQPSAIRAVGGAAGSVGDVCRQSLISGKINIGNLRDVLTHSDQKVSSSGFSQTLS